MHELQVTTLKKVAFAQQSHEHIDRFVVEEKDHGGRDSPVKVTQNGFTDRGVVIDKCLAAREADDEGKVDYKVKSRSKHGV